MIGLAGCVPNDQLVITQQNISDAKENIAEGISTRVDTTVNAITDSVEAVKKDLLKDEDTNLSEDEETASPTEGDEIVIAAIQEDTPAPPPSLNPDTLKGVGIENLIRQLGSEDYRRLDQDILVLHFRLPSCVVDFVMSADQRVSSFHTRHRVSGQPYDDVSCRLDLAARRDEQ